MIKSQARIAKSRLQEVAVLEFGLFDYLRSEHQSLLESLQVFFPENYQALFLLSMFRLAYQSPLKHINFYYQNSYAREELPGVKLGDKSLTQLFREIGSQRPQIVNFLKTLMRQESHFLIDQTHIISFSEQLPWNKLGYNSQKVFDPQVNLLFIFSAQSKSPCFYRLLPGDIREVSTLKNTLLESGLQEALVIGDKGFYSAKNIEMLEEEQLSYILPLRRNHSLCDYSPILEGHKKDFEAYFSFEKRIIWYKSFEKSDKGQKKRKIVLFLDNELKNAEEKDYLLRIQEGKEGYNLEKFHKKQKTFGTICLCHNLDDISCPKLFEYLKSRNEIEVMIDTYKNTLDADRTYMRGQQEMETWSFINFLALMMHYKLYHQLVKKDLLKKYSPKDLILCLQNIRKIKIANQWIDAEITQKTQNVLNLLRN
ncbi:MAG: transposase [Microscillaceae bacterium]|nr:transposase [Microscillaceae bacterium]